LRNNPGGLLTEAVALSDLFLPSGGIVSIKGRKQQPEVYKAKSQNDDINLPLAVMINNGSASAAEIFAAAMSDNHRAKLYGTKSFGKGSVQTVINLDNGDALKITIAHYFTPANHMIDGKGIEPDVALDLAGFKKSYPDFSKIDPTTNEEASQLRQKYDAYQLERTIEMMAKNLK
jgi:carboxyl-terminal processing protease